MTAITASSNLQNEVIIHVFVVGFHHKKGCVVEFSYPPLSSEDHVVSNDLPELWKHLPTLALPDGAHNYEEDTIYFHLPALDDPSQTVYGISCYRQINAQKLLRRSSDITRETVQKSVCVISRLPLYGLIQAKLELITHAYFDERDFSKVSLLEETYRNLNSSLPKELSDGQQAFLGLSVRDFVLRFKHKSLLLFKLLLLERKVLFYKAPVKDLCSTVLTLCSLVPGLIESGLSESATFSASKSPDLLNDLCDGDISVKDNNNLLMENMCTNTLSNNENCNTSNYECNFNNNLISPVKSTVKDVDVIPPGESNTNSDNVNYTKCNELDNQLSQSSSDTENDSWIKVNQLAPEMGSSIMSMASSSDAEAKVENMMPNCEDALCQKACDVLKVNCYAAVTDSELVNDSRCMSETDVHRFVSHINLTKDHSSNSLPLAAASQHTSLDCGDGSTTKTLSESQSQNLAPFSCDIPNVIDIEPAECGLPLAIFTKGMLCHPYLSLPFLDLLSDLSVRGFLIGATNILFKQKKHLFDVIVEVDEGKVEILDPDLRRSLSLTTEDLRFADHLLRHVMEDKKDVFLDGTGWEGGDEWLRSQFKLYLLSVMRTSLISGGASKEAEAFNSGFISLWKLTHNYRIWNGRSYAQISRFPPGHPFHGQLSMADMRLKFSHSMQSSEKGRRLNSAVASTGKAVLQTGKAVGGALSSAKSVVSSWWSSFNVQEKQEDKNNKSIEGEPADVSVQVVKDEAASDANAAADNEL